MRFIPKNESGSAFLVVVILIAVVLMMLDFLSRRATNESNETMAAQINSERIAVRSSLSWNLLCEASLLDKCTVGQLTTALNKGKEVLVKEDGSSKIGGLNVRVECLARGQPEFWVTTSRRSEANEVLRNPLTGSPMDWNPLVAVKDLCFLVMRKSDKILSNTCYGLDEGKLQIPSETKNRCSTCGSSKMYCDESQINFPTCPEGYEVFNTYIDRFGWGGVDVSKNTVCRQSNSEMKP